jgi:hypothetical protein
MSLFVLTLFLFSQLAVPNSSVTLFITTCFLNGFCTGAGLNYTLSHLLFLAAPHDHFFVTGLLATFRGFAGSFGSAIGSGVFLRVLQSSLETGFRDRNMEGKEDLIRRLLGSPALVGELEGKERAVAILGYGFALQRLFVSASVLALVMVAVQGGTGWKAPNVADEVSDEEETTSDEEETVGEQEEEARARMVD